MTDPDLTTLEQTYSQLAREFDGTSGEILDKLQKLARAEALKILRANRTLSKKRLAERFREIADRCYQVAVKEHWGNDYALDIGEFIHSAVMSVRP